MCGKDKKNSTVINFVPNCQVPSFSLLPDGIAPVSHLNPIPSGFHQFLSLSSFGPTTTPGFNTKFLCVYNELFFLSEGIICLDSC